MAFSNNNILEAKTGQQQSCEGVEAGGAKDAQSKVEQSKATNSQTAHIYQGDSNAFSHQKSLNYQVGDFSSGKKISRIGVSGGGGTEQHRLTMHSEGNGSGSQQSHGTGVGNLTYSTNKTHSTTLDKFNLSSKTPGGIENLKFVNSHTPSTNNVIDNANINPLTGLGYGDDTTTSTTSKRPQFQFVCMEPTKDQKAAQSVKQYSIANKDNRLAQLIEPATLQRILKLQQQQKSQFSHHHHHYNHMQGISGSGPISSYLRSHYNSINGGGGGTTTADGKDFQLRRNIMHDMDKIGICGVPSLWMSKDELLEKGHVFREHIEECERLEIMLRILQSHKKYENDKYFGGSIFKRGSLANNGNASQNGGGNSVNQQAQTGYIQTIQMASGIGTGSCEYVWFSTDNLQKIKFTNQNGSDKLKEEIVEFSAQTFPHIRRYDQPDALTFKIFQAEAKLVRLILESHCFTQTDQNDWNLLWTCTSSQQKQFIYENLHEYQKINHFVSASELTRKDRLCFNVGKMQQKFGKQHFDFLPETYILPEEYPEFLKQFKERQQLQQLEENETLKNLWIIKPQTSSQGKGIFMIDDISEVPQNEQLVISRYIDNPLLINGLKFDLRLYVLVTNFDPLKIYIYNEGLVRFASEPYNIESIKSNVYAHLTNYSINKKSENFVQNKNISERDFGNKWSLSALQSHLERLGIDMKLMWARIYDCIIKSIISIEGQVVAALKKVQDASGSSIKSNCFDLFGFDIILDSDLKPWILEVNLSPSLAFDSPLDFHIKSNLIVDVLNVVGIRRFNRKKEALGKHLQKGKAQKQHAEQGLTPPINSQLTTQTSTTASSNGQISGVGAAAADQGKRRQAGGGGNHALSGNSANATSQSQLKNLDDSKPPTQPSNNHFTGNGFNNIDITHMEKLSKLSAKHRELLREHLEEFCMMRQLYSPIPGISPALLQNQKCRRHNFTRVFPAPGTNVYDIYFSQDTSAQSSSQQPQQKQWNKILYRYLYDRTSELQEIVNQVQKYNRQHYESQQRRGSQGKHLSSAAKRDEESLSREDNPQSSFLRPSEGEGKHQQVIETSLGGGGGGGNPSRKGTRQESLSSSVQPPLQLQNQHQAAATAAVASSTQENFSKVKISQPPPPRSQSSMSNTLISSGQAQSEGSGAIGHNDIKSSDALAFYQTNLRTIDHQNVHLSPINGYQQQPLEIVKKNSSTSGNVFNSVNKHHDVLIETGSMIHQKEVKPQTSSSSHPQQQQQTLLQSVEHMNSAGLGRISYQNSKTANATLEKQKETTNRQASGALSYGETPTTTSGQANTGASHLPQADTRIVVTGDDILIEYVRRIMILTKQCHYQQVELSMTVHKKLEQFITHKIWLPKEEKNQSLSQQFQNKNVISGPSQQLWQKIEGRFNEMGDRKRRLFVKKFQSEHKSKDVPADYVEKLFRQQEKQKTDIVKDFSSSELELMLMQSNKNNPIEVVTLLLSQGTQQGPTSAGGSGQSNFGGVLTKLEQETNRFQKSGSSLVKGGKTITDGFQTRIEVPVAAAEVGVAAARLTGEKSFDNHSPLKGGNTQGGAQGDNRHYQNQIINRLRASDERMSQGSSGYAALNNGKLQYTNKEGADTLQSIKSGSANGGGGTWSIGNIRSNISSLQ